MWNLNAVAELPPLSLLPSSFLCLSPGSTLSPAAVHGWRSSAKCLCNFRLKFVTIRQTVWNYAENRRKLKRRWVGEGGQRLIFNRIHECTYDLPRQICKTISRHTHTHTSAGPTTCGSPATTHWSGVCRTCYRYYSEGKRTIIIKFCIYI